MGKSLSLALNLAVSLKLSYGKKKSLLKNEQRQSAAAAAAAGAALALPEGPPRTAGCNPLSSPPYTLTCKRHKTGSFCSTAVPQSLEAWQRVGAQPTIDGCMLV